MDDDCDFEHSPLSGRFTRDGIMVDVEIYRDAGTQDRWHLAVIDLSSGRCTDWRETFATDQEAYEAFTTMVEANGLAPVVGSVPSVLH